MGRGWITQGLCSETWILSLLFLHMVETYLIYVLEILLIAIGEIEDGLGVEIKCENRETS